MAVQSLLESEPRHDNPRHASIFSHLNNSLEDVTELPWVAPWLVTRARKTERRIEQRVKWDRKPPGEDDVLWE